MLLYTHPVNDAREARGALPVNSFWLSGCGVRAGRRPPRRRRRSTTACARPRWPTTGRPGPRPGSALDAGPIAGPAAARRSAASRSRSRCAASAARSASSRAAAAACWRAPARSAVRRHASRGAPCWSRCEHADADLRDVPPRAAWALEQAGVHPLLARLFAARGVRSADELDDGLARLLPPAGLQGAQAAARLLADAIARRQRICIVADYDCDGATACAVALRGLALLGAAPGTLGYVVPDRVVHGYGLTPAIVDLARRSSGADVLITVDNGIASLDGVAACARAAASHVLVTDHHLPALVDDAVVLPEADVIVNPNQPGCTLREQDPGRRRRDVLRAAGAARRAARARRASTRAAQPRLDALLDLVALGTVADVVQARRQQPPPGRAGPEAHPRRPHAARRGGAVRGGRARPGARQRPSTSASRSGRASTPPAACPT